MTLATGDTVNGIPIVCSGFAGVAGTPTNSYCYVYKKVAWLGEKYTWVRYIQTIYPKVYHASSISLTNALFVTGGYEPISKVNVNTANLVFTNGTIKNGPNMPEGRVSVQGVKSLWVDCMIIPAKWGSKYRVSHSKE